MKRYFAVVFCSGLLLASWSAPNARAQAGDAEAHVAAARAASYEPGHDLTNLFDTCDQKSPAAPAVAAAGPVTPQPLPRNQWYMEPVKAFDNIYYLGPT